MPYVKETVQIRIHREPGSAELRFVRKETSVQLRIG